MFASLNVRYRLKPIFPAPGWHNHLFAACNARAASGEVLTLRGMNVH
jgi:hypothetical protein